MSSAAAHNKPLHATCETHAREGRRWAALTPIASILVLILSTLTSFSPAVAEEAEPSSVKCETGPLPRSFGDTKWLVYVCEDGHSLVVVSAEGNPASPFYFMFAWDNGSYQLHGEGTGDKKATQAAFDELSKLDELAVASLAQEVLNDAKR